MSAASDHFCGGVAVVTGGGAGLGEAMARRFAAQNMAIALLDIDGANAEASAERLRQTGADAMALRCDVSKQEELDAAARLVSDRFGACSVLCANVGVQQFGAIDLAIGRQRHCPAYSS